MHLPAELVAAGPFSIVEAFPFATLLALPSGLAAHVPLLLETRGEQRVLAGHVARASALGAAIADGTELLAIFTGPHAYVSPYDYDADGQGPGHHVPTWNYLAAHVRGTARPVEGDAVRAMLQRLAQRFDARGWTDAALPHDYRAGLERAIVAFELPVEQIVGKEKLGQNRRPEHRRAAAEALMRRPSEMDREVGRRMREAGET